MTTHNEIDLSRQNFEESSNSSTQIYNMELCKQ